jgi:hypothetical protein
MRTLASVFLRRLLPWHSPALRARCGAQQRLFPSWSRGAQKCRRPNSGAKPRHLGKLADAAECQRPECGGPALCKDSCSAGFCSLRALSRQQPHLYCLAFLSAFAGRAQPPPLAPPQDRAPSRHACRGRLFSMLSPKTRLFMRGVACAPPFLRSAPLAEQIRRLCRRLPLADIAVHAPRCGGFAWAVLPACGESRPGLPRLREAQRPLPASCDLLAHAPFYIPANRWRNPPDLAGCRGRAKAVLCPASIFSRSGMDKWLESGVLMVSLQ